MDILKKVKVGVDIFNENLTIRGYNFCYNEFCDMENIFHKIKDINLLNYIEKTNELKEFFYKISKSMGIRLFKPVVFLSMPEEFYITNFNNVRDDFSSIILDSGWSKVYFVQEIIAAAIGCNLPFNQLKSNGLYEKSIFIFCKKNSTTFSIGCAGGMFKSYVVSSKLSEISQKMFEDIINKINREGIELPKTFISKSHPNEIKDQLKASWEEDINKTIYLMAPEGEKDDFINKIQGFDFVAPFGYQLFVPLGLDKIMDYALNTVKKQ